MLLVLAQIVGYAAPVPSELQYRKGFLVTGNYVVAGVDLTEAANPIVGGLSTGIIQLGDVVPANADIIAAHLFWETITFTADRSQAAGVKFRGLDVDIDSLTVHEASEALNGNQSACWSSGTPLTMHHFEADVLRLLPMRLDKDNKPTGKRIVNDSDLAANGLPAHTVSLPMLPGGNHVPESGGATLLVVYREDPDPGVAPTEPLRKIVIYSGKHIQDSIEESTTLNVQGFYKSAPGSARLTYIGASGNPNNKEKIRFNGQALPGEPFSLGSSSQRGWANPTYDVSGLMNLATNSAQYGETVTTSLDHSPTNGSYDCLTTAAVVFSTTVQDIDHDGLPDGLEDSSTAMTDPDGTPLPNLKAMGAGSDQPDLFVEVNAMSAPAGTSYGSATNPYSPTITTKTDSVGHHHMPTPEDLKRIGDVLAGRGYRPHFDVGNVASYHGLGVVNHTGWIDDYSSPDADQYLVGNGVGTNVASLARGGEIITETACGATQPGCDFPDFPGTVDWKFGFQLHRDRLVGDDGEEVSLNPADPDYFDWNAGTHRRRFDLGRHDVFRYLLFAHARGPARSLPCLVDDFPAPYDANNGTTCVTNNPGFNPLFFHVPTTASGIADLPGFNLLVTVGLWDEHVGRPFSRAGTAFHELGHNLELWHGGISPIWGNKGLNTATYIEPQCKPFHLSSMSYLFQVHGLFDDSDAINLDFSGTEHAGAVETGTLSDAALYPAASYLPAWFAPAGSTLAGQLGVSPSTRFCPGKNAGGAAGSMARVYADSSSAFIDWNGDTVNNASLFQQDVNFDGTLTGAPRLLNGFNDWNNIRLDQVGAVATGLIPGSGEDLSKQLGDLAAELAELAAELAGNPDPAVQALAGQLFGLTQNLGGLGQSQGGVGQGLGGIGQALGGIGQALGGIGQALGGVGQGLGGVGQALGGVGQGLGGVGQALGGVAQNQGGVAQNQGGQDELSYTHANELGKSKPYGLTVCVIGRDAGCSTAATFTPNYHRIEGHFNAPPFGDFTSFEVQRRRAAGGPFVTVGTTSTTSFIDLTELADSVFQTPDLFYVYRVRGLAADGNSPWSRLSAPIDPVNNPPVASGDGPFTVDNRGTLTMDVLANDTDDDSPPAFLGRRPLITQQPTSGNLTPNVNGTLTYVPPRNFSGQTLTVTFKYKADDGLSSDTPQVPLSAPSNEEITVTITVFKTK